MFQIERQFTGQNFDLIVSETVMDITALFKIVRNKNIREIYVVSNENGTATPGNRYIHDFFHRYSSQCTRQKTEFRHFTKCSKSGCSALIERFSLHSKGSK